MNIKFLNQTKLTDTVTPVNTKIATGDDGQVVAQKLQGQLNFITPTPGIITTYSANTTGTTLLTNTTNYQAVVGASITVGAGTWLLSYAASATVTANPATAGFYIIKSEIYNVTAASEIASSIMSLSNAPLKNSVYITWGGSGGATVVATVAGSTVFQIYMSINNITNLTDFYASNCVITGVQIG